MKPKLNRQKVFYWSLERGDLLPLLLMTPTLLIIFFVMILPLLYGLYLSLFDVGFGTVTAENFVGLANYARFFQDPVAQKAIWNTLLFSAGAIVGDMFFGTVGALLLNKMARWLGNICRPLMTIPLLVSPVVVGLIWRYLYDPSGILYWALGKVGLGLEQFPGVTSSATALLCCIIAQWWQVVPFYIIVLTAGLLSISEDYYEAATVDGAGPVVSFFRITLPLMQNVYMTAFLVSGVDTIKIFDIIYALTGGGPNNSSLSISIYAYSQGFEMSSMGYAMALSFIAMLVTFVVFGVPFIRHNAKKEKE
ncbi:sugar ABC transporter permease [Subdoligranulum sp. AM16-9]|nr:sugar ABC transporter permease [Subdoligranulum sp. AM16-9]